VANLALRSTDAALAAARDIEDPWYACQALATVARFAPEDRVEAIASEALAAAREAKDPYRLVGSGAWPVRALVERQRLSALDPTVTELLRHSLRIESPASRSEALFLLFEAVFPAGIQHWRPVLDELFRSSDPVVHWRQRRNLRDAMIIVAGEDPALAEELSQGLHDDKLSRQIGSRLREAERHGPRQFFWRTIVDSAGRPATGGARPDEPP
jgi:hypothetical protein